MEITSFSHKHHSELSKEEISIFCKFLNVKRNTIPESYWEQQWHLFRKYGDKFRKESLEKHLIFIEKLTS